MKIGVDFSVRKSDGGAYQYCLVFLDTIKENINDDRFFIFNSSPDLPVEDYKNYFEIIDLASADSGQQSFIYKIKELGYRILLFFHMFFLVGLLFRFFYRKQLGRIKSSGVEAMVFPSGAKYAPFINVPYVVTIYDLEHRKNPQFPEISRQGRYLSREYYFKSVCRTAKLILVDSEVGKQDVVNFYEVNPEKIVVLPYLPSNYLVDDITVSEAKLITKDFNLPEKFLFYPAQFWPHKNHINLVKAVEYLKQQGLIVNLVFSGTEKEEWGEYDRVFEYIKKNKLDDQVWHLGYVDNNIISALYRLATSMSMPTFLGPTNIPVLEAWKMSCPVLYSDIRGCREQMGEAGVLFNPADYKDMADKIEKVWQDENVRNDMIEKGKKRLANWTGADFSRKVIEILNSLKK